MKKIIISLAFIAIGLNAFGQKFFTKEGQISFYSEAPMEKIEAHNSRVTAVIDTESGGVEFALLIKSFQFEKALMQEHFNENYMESSKFPKALFKGRITNLDDVDFSESGEYSADITGDLTLHGVTNEINTAATLRVDGNGFTGTSDLVLAVADYDIKIPGVVADNIAKEIEVKIEADFQPLEK